MKGEERNGKERGGMERKRKEKKEELWVPEFGKRKLTEFLMFLTQLRANVYGGICKILIG